MMLLIDYTCATPAEDLALDELLLDEAEATEGPREFLRLWEPLRPMVVVGRSSRVAEEVRVEECRRRDVPIFRRSSGGAAIVTGPGCLMYAVVLSYQEYPALRAIDLAHRHVMGKLVGALRSLVPGVEFQGTCDLTLEARKFSGNALRCRREHLLYHGTLLYDFPLELIEQCLAAPPRTPDYREGRAHSAFVTNLPVSRESLRSALLAAWPTSGEYRDWDQAALQRIADEKFRNESWNAKL